MPTLEDATPHFSGSSGSTVVGHEAGERPVKGHVGSRDRGGACAAVCLNDVAIDGYRSLAELVEVDRGPQRASDEPLDLLRPAFRPAATLPASPR